MDSFYGGRQGRTYNIVARFPDISAMTSAFAQSTYTAVNFGQYVMIDTINEPEGWTGGTWTPRWTDRQNGAIYRRGFDITNTIAPDSTTIVNPGNGAIYVGQIPSGQPGDSIENVQVNADTNQVTYDIRHWDMNSSESSASSATAGYITAVKDISLQTTNNGVLDPVFKQTKTISGESIPSTFGHLNYPARIDRKGDNLIVLYSDKAVRDTIPTNKKTTYSYDQQDYDWQNLGGISSQFHIYGEYTATGSSSAQDRIKNDYPYGLGKNSIGADTNIQIQGWLITVPSTETRTVDGVTSTYDCYDCYAYDYVKFNNLASTDAANAKECWYKMGDFSTDVAADKMSENLEPERIMIIGTTAQQSDIASSLNNHGYWFVKE